MPILNVGDTGLWMANAKYESSIKEKLTDYITYFYFLRLVLVGYESKLKIYLSET